MHLSHLWVNIFEERVELWVFSLLQPDPLELRPDWPDGLLGEGHVGLDSRGQEAFDLTQEAGNFPQPTKNIS